MIHRSFHDFSRLFYYAPNQLDQHQFPLQHRQREFIAMAVLYNCVRILTIASLEILAQLYTVYIVLISQRKRV